MRLSVGDRLGRFEILGPLGAGGMGDVYRARDPQLQREVAIKVLPAAFSRDPDRQRRFEQEARAAAQPESPEHRRGPRRGRPRGLAFIVTELLEGETLRQRMNGRPLAPRRAVDYAIQIAGGLAAGHERGIVHRDVKPDNLFVTKDGRLKILDFGLAKLTGPDVSGDVTATLTIDGVPLAPVMGTAAYMSPEQARGLRTDHRTDIFSLECPVRDARRVSAFRRGTMADTLSAILNDDPPELISLAPVDRALERIVRPLRGERPRASGSRALRISFFALDALPHRPARVGDTAVAALARLSKSARVRGDSVLLAVAAAAALGYLAGNGRSPARTIDDALDSPAPDRIRRARRISLDLARSKLVAFTANANGRRQIFVRLLAGGPPVPITRIQPITSFPAGRRMGTRSCISRPPARMTLRERSGAFRAGRLSPADHGSIGGADVNTRRPARLLYARRREHPARDFFSRWIGRASRCAVRRRLSPVPALVS